jgi:hypothetical protein
MSLDATMPLPWERVDVKPAVTKRQEKEPPPLPALNWTNFILNSDNLLDIAVAKIANPPPATVSGWYATFVGKMHSLVTLGDELAPSKDCLSIGLEVLDEALRWNLEPKRVEQSSEGGLGFSWEKNGRFASIECLNTGWVVSLQDDGKQYPKASEILPRELPGVVRSLSEFLG